MLCYAVACALSAQFRGLPSRMSGQRRSLSFTRRRRGQQRLEDDEDEAFVPYGAAGTGASDFGGGSCGGAGGAKRGGVGSMARVGRKPSAGGGMGGGDSDYGSYGGSGSQYPSAAQVLADEFGAPRPTSQDAAARRAFRESATDVEDEAAAREREEMEMALAISLSTAKEEANRRIPADGANDGT
eukprot:6189506-Pleurochrysis_carterae.AAC.2